MKVFIKASSFLGKLQKIKSTGFRESTQYGLRWKNVTGIKKVQCTSKQKIKIS